MVNRGGLVAYGGMIGGFLASWYCCRKREIPLLQWADVAAPSVVLGTAITRIGCFLFGCDYGARSEPAVGGVVPRPEHAGAVGQPGLATPRARLRAGRRRGLVVPGAPDADLRSRWSACSCSGC